MSAHEEIAVSTSLAHHKHVPIKDTSHYLKDLAKYTEDMQGISTVTAEFYAVGLNPVRGKRKGGANANASYCIFGPNACLVCVNAINNALLHYIEHVYMSNSLKLSIILVIGLFWSCSITFLSHLPVCASLH